MLTNLEHINPIGKSDHETIMASLQLSLPSSSKTTTIVHINTDYNNLEIDIQVALVELHFEFHLERIYDFHEKALDQSSANPDDS